MNQTKSSNLIEQAGQFALECSMKENSGRDGWRTFRDLQEQMDGVKARVQSLVDVCRAQGLEVSYAMASDAVELATWALWIFEAECSSEKFCREFGQHREDLHEEIKQAWFRKLDGWTAYGLGHEKSPIAGYCVNSDPRGLPLGIVFKSGASNNWDGESWRI